MPLPNSHAPGNGTPGRPNNLDVDINAADFVIANGGALGVKAATDDAFIFASSSDTRSIVGADTPEGYKNDLSFINWETVVDAEHGQSLEPTKETSARREAGTADTDISGGAPYMDDPFLLG